MSYWIRVDPKSNDWCIRKQRMCKEAHRPRGDRERCKDGGSKWSDTSIYKPRNTKDCWELPEKKKRQGRVLPQSLQIEGRLTCWPSNFRLLVARTVRIYFYCFKPSNLWQLVNLLRAILVGLYCWWLSGKEPTCQCRTCRLDPLEKEMATNSSILAWEISWAEKPSWLWSTGSPKELNTI